MSDSWRTLPKAATTTGRPVADLSTLERNDVKGAMAVYEQAWRDSGGEVSPHLVHVLFMLQDTGDELGDALEAFADAHPTK